MKTISAQARKRSRVALGSAMALVVGLPLGASLGLGLAASPAGAVVPAPASTQASPAEVTGDSAGRGTGGDAPESNAVAWTANRAASAAAAAAGETFDALVFSKTAAFRHSSIDEGVAAIQRLATENNFTVTATEDAAAFTDANLERYEVVIFLSTTGDVLNETQQGAFERYIQGGGGYAGIHSASDTEYSWPWYGNLVGSYFDGHPPGTPSASVKVEDPAHPSTAGIESRWQRTDEWYNYRSNPRGKVHVLASLDESTYGGGAMGHDHPIAWCQDYDGGRSWYTGMGHTEDSYTEPKFLQHILGGIQTAAGVLPSDCAATLEPSFEKVALDENSSNPMELAIADDGRVFYVDRNGAVRVIRPNGAVVTAGNVPVYTGQEFGLLGLALDPNFATNSWLYLYYSPLGTTATDRVSRWTVDPASDSLIASSKVDIIDIPTQREQCCHAGGALEFDRDGNLYIATGDNVNPFDSDGYSPIDERPGRSAWDAQRTSANTNSLSGKVLRIKPLAAGGYQSPAGNLFPEAADTQQKTRPEIYAMGFRNPFRIGLDEQNNNLLVADYGPDAGAVSPTRGPNGRVEWNILDEPGNYGWPYCVGNNTPYNDYNFTTSTAGPAFSCSAPVNDSPNNTGLTNLPPAKAAVIWQSNNGSITGTPEIGGSGAPMTSGTYDYKPELVSDRKWPAYFDRKAIWADWNNSRLFTVQIAQDGTNYTDINRFLPSLPMTRPHALQFGPDGALYMIEWGSGFGGNNADSGIYRIDYVQGNRAPIARASANRTSGPAPLTVTFDGSASLDPDGSPLTYSWDFNGDGTADGNQATGSYTYTTVGDYTARLTVTDSDGRSAVTNIDIVVGNTAPSVELVLPADGGFFEFGDTMRYEVVVTDPEDATIDCSRVVVQPGLGHDEHAHGYEQYTGCSGVLPLPGDEGHVGADIFGTITASYTDRGAGGASALRGQDTIVVHTKHKEAEFFDATGRLAGSTSAGAPGVVTETTGDPAGGGLNIGYVEPGDWIAWDVMNLTKINSLSLRVAAPTAGTVWEVRTGSATGPTVATINVPNTGGWQTYQDVSAPVTNSTVSGRLFFVQVAGGSNLNWIDFRGDGVTDNRRPVLTASADTTSGPGPLTVAFDASATDPDNDAVTFAWSFGDGQSGTGARLSHTYTTAGTYQATVTATDARGAKSSKTFQIKVLGATENCFTGRSDSFDGSALDTGRWDSVVRPDGKLTVSGGHLTIPLAEQDIYGGNGTPAPNLVLQHLPGGAFTVTTKVTMAAVRQYQQAGLVIYGDDNNYLKLVLQGRTASPDKAANVVQFAKEVGGTATETNTNGLGAAFPDTFWLRLTSTNGLAVTASYSADGQDYTEVPGARDLAGINEPRVGVMAFANNPDAANITAKFDYFHITPDDRATPCTSDTTGPQVGATVLGSYAGKLVDQAGSGIRGDATLVSAAAGSGFTSTAKLTLTGLDPAEGYESHLHVGTSCGGFEGHYRDDPDGAGSPPNELWPTNPGWGAASGRARIAPAADGTSYAEATVGWAPRIDGGILALHRGGAIVGCIDLGLTGPGTVVLSAKDDGGVSTVTYQVDGGAETAYTGPFRVTAAGTHLVAYTATDAAGNVTKGQFDVVVPKDAPNPQPTVKPSVTISSTPATAGGNSWFTAPVALTLKGAGSDAPLVLEYRIGNGSWTAYVAPFKVSAEGTTLVQARATDAGGRTSEVVSRSVRIDATAPAVTIAGIADGQKLNAAAVRTALVSATDQTSGVGRRVIRLDNQPVSAPVRIDAMLLRTGRHELEVTVTDEAGNRASENVSFKVVAAYGGGRKLIDRLGDEKKIGAALVTKLRKELAAAERADRRGDLPRARRAFKRFQRLVSRVKDAGARAALTHLARRLKAQL